jgi:GT2 family glycosyltransferase
MKENTGLIRSCQYAYEYAKSQSYDILCLTHNDVWVYKENWDKIVKTFFNDGWKLGGVGLFGSKGCGKEGHRLNTFGSLIEMSGHGRKIEEEYEPAVTFDGFFMAFSMEMLKKAGGFDQRYQMHHMYDLDASLTSIKLGYKNIVLNLPCHHLSGLTANNDAKSVCGPDVHTTNSLLWKEKWSHQLGVMVDDNFNYRWSL